MLGRRLSSKASIPNLSQWRRVQECLIRQMSWGAASVGQLERVNCLQHFHQWSCYGWKVSPLQQPISDQAPSTKNGHHCSLPFTFCYTRSDSLLLLISLLLFPFDVHLCLRWCCCLDCGSNLITWSGSWDWLGLLYQLVPLLLDLCLLSWAIGDSYLLVCRF